MLMDDTEQLFAIKPQVDYVCLTSLDVPKAIVYSRLSQTVTDCTDCGTDLLYIARCAMVALIQEFLS